MLPGIGRAHVAMLKHLLFKRRKRSSKLGHFLNNVVGDDKVDSLHSKITVCSERGDPRREGAQQKGTKHKLKIVSLTKETKL